MEDLNNKITGGVLTADEWNQVPSELQNVIEQTGQTLTSADLNQLGKGLANYVANSNFYTDSGVADAYVLTSIGSKQSPTAYVDGMTVEFLPGNTNTGVSTVNVATLGVKSITGATAGDIVSGLRVVLKYRLATGDFVIDGGGDVVEEVNNVITGTGQTPDDVDQNQLGKGIAEYSANGDFYTDGGAADAYVLSVIGSKQGPVDYVDGMRVRFIAANTNTLATATVNVAGLGVKNIVNLTAGDITTSIQNTITYRISSGDFILVGILVAAGSVGAAEINTAELGPRIQSVETIFTSVRDATTGLPFDDTIPQITEGNAADVVVITPESTSSVIEVESLMYVSSDTDGANDSSAIFEGAIANALVSGSVAGNVDYLNLIYIKVRVPNSALVARTFRQRLGTTAGTLTQSGIPSGVRRHGGVMIGFIRATEYLRP